MADQAPPPPPPSGANRVDPMIENPVIDDTILISQVEDEEAGRELNARGHALHTHRHALRREYVRLGVAFRSGVGIRGRTIDRSLDYWERTLRPALATCKKLFHRHNTAVEKMSEELSEVKGEEGKDKHEGSGEKEGEGCGEKDS